MLKSRIIYILSLIAAVAFMFFHNRPVAYITVIALLILPIISLMVFLFYYKKIYIKIMKFDSHITKDKKLSFNIFVENKSVLPIPLFKIKGKIAFLTYDLQDDIVLKGYINSKGASAISYQTFPLYRGLLQLNIKEIKVYDYLGLFSYKKRINISKMAVVSPKLGKMDIEAQRHMLFGESDEFSSEVAGDDVSEVFRVREYTPGDRVKAIHWKISSRSKNLIVRDFSQPIINNIVIATDFMSYYENDIENIACVDKIAEIALQLSATLLERGVNSTIIWYSFISKDLLSLNINNTMDYEIAQSTLSAEKLYTSGIDFSDLLKIFTSENENNNKIYCVSSFINSKTKETLLDIVTRGIADINLFYVKNNFNEEQEENIKTIKNSSIEVKDFKMVDYNNKFNIYLDKIKTAQEKADKKRKTNKSISAQKNNANQGVGENK